MRKLEHTLLTRFGRLVATIYDFQPFVRFNTVSFDFCDIFYFKEL
jgi:hypothetical protein